MGRHPRTSSPGRAHTATLVVAVGVVVVLAWWVWRGEEAPRPVGPQAPTTAGDAADAPTVPGLHPLATEGEGSEAQATAWVHGAVWGAGGVVDAQVRVVTVPPGADLVQAYQELRSPRARPVQSKGDAGYRVPIVAEARAAVAAVAMDGRWGTLQFVSPQKAGAKVGIGLSLADGPHALEVHVQDGQGAPVDVWVGAFGRWGSAETGGLITGLQRTQGGRVRLPGLHAGIHAIYVRRGATQFKRYHVVVPASEPVVVNLPSASWTLPIHVLERGSDRPIPRARLRVAGRLESGILWIWRSDAWTSGATMHIPGPPLIANASAPGWHRGSREFVGDRPTEATVHLSPWCEASGMVTDPEGQPVPGARVHAVPVDRRGTPRGLHHLVTTETDVQGRFRFTDLRQGPTWFWVHGPAWVSGDLRGLGDGRLHPVHDVRPHTAVHVPLSVEPAGVVVGRLASTSGEGLADYTLGIARVAHGVPIRRWRTEVEALATRSTTSANGRFRFEGLVPGVPYALIPVWNGDATLSVETFDVAAGEIKDLASVVVQDPGDPHDPGTYDVEVRVVDTRGVAIPHALVEAQLAEMPLEPLRTDERGRLRLRAPMSQYVSVSAWSTRHAPRSVYIEPGAKVLEIGLIEGRHVELEVQWPDGTPVRRGMVHWVHDEDLPEEEVTWSAYEFEETWSPSGRFVCRHVPPGIRAVRFEAAREGLEHEAEVRLPHPPSIPVRLKPVEDAVASRGTRLNVAHADGTPIRDVRVHAIREKTNGRLEADPVWPGRDGCWVPHPDRVRWLLIGPRGAPDATRSPWGETRVGPYPEGLGLDDVHVVVDAPRSVSGRVVDGEGHPQPGIRVEIATLPPATVEHPPVWFESVRTDDDGRFRVAGLGALSYRVRVPVDGEWDTLERDVEGGTQDVVLRLRRRAEIEVTVLLPSGEPLAGAKVSVRTPRDEHWVADTVGGVTDIQGRIRLAGLDAGRNHRLWILPPAHHPDVQSLSLPRWRPQSQTFTLDDNEVLRGQVTGPRGEPLSGVEVIYRSGALEGKRDRTWTDPHGQFVFMEVVQGEGWITLHAMGAPRASRHRIGMEIPTKDPLDLRMDPGSALHIIASSSAKDVNVAWIPAASDGGDARARWLRSVEGRWTLYGRDGRERSALWAEGEVGGTKRVLWMEVPADQDRVELRWPKVSPARLVLKGPLVGDDLEVAVDVAVPWVEDHVHSTGTASIAVPLPPGTWTLRIHAQDGQHHWSGEVDATAGDQVVVDLIRGDAIDD